MSFTKDRFQLDFLPFLPIFSWGMASAIGLCWLTSTLGASVGSGGEAVLCTFLILIMMWTVQSLVGWRASAFGYALPALLWPCWWPVLKSMTLREVDPASGVVLLRSTQTWYNGVWLKALVEVGLLVLFACTAIRTPRASETYVDDTSAGHALPSTEDLPKSIDARGTLAEE